jgi:beta-lactamase class A
LNLETLQGRILSEALLAGIQIGVFYEHFGTGDTIAIHADTPFASASVIKIPVLVAFLCAVERGDLSLDQTVEMDLNTPEWTQEEGSGILTHLTSRIALNLRDMALLMITLSDNLATNQLIRMLDLGVANADLARFGVQHTRITMPCDNWDELRKDTSNPMTARDAGILLRAIHEKRVPHSDLALDILFRQFYNTRLPFLIAQKDLKIAHKTGSLNGMAHDVGLFVHPDYAYSLSIFTKHFTTGAVASMAIARMSAWVHEHVRLASYVTKSDNR